MNSFEKFLRKIYNKPEERIVSVFGNEKRIKAMVRLTSKNYLEGEYTKIMFDDSSFLLIIPQDEKIYYADRVVEHIKEIPDDWIGKKTEIIYKNRKYRLDNPNDYQFVLQMICGSPLDIEGECSFSDYRPSSGPDAFLSLGWLARTGKRADIDPDILDIKDITIQ